MCAASLHLFPFGEELFDIIGVEPLSGSDMEWQAFDAVLAYGSHKAAAFHLGISLIVLDRRLKSLRQRNGDITMLQLVARWSARRAQEAVA